MESLSQERLSEEDFKKINYWMIDNLTDEGNEKWLLAYGEIKRLQAIEAERDQLEKHATDFEEMFKQEHREKNRYKRALNKIVCCNVSIPDEIWETANNALEGVNDHE